MFREMRRKGQALSREMCETILNSATSGVLALEGDNGYPYAVPLSFVFDAGKMYFHCATEGHKIDAVRKNARASFCVIGQDEVAPERYTTDYRSVIVFGTIRILEETGEKRAAIEKLAVKYSPQEGEAARRTEIEQSMPGLCVLELDIQHLSGKQGRGLAQSQPQCGKDVF